MARLISYAVLAFAATLMTGCSLSLHPIFIPAPVNRAEEPPAIPVPPVSPLFASSSIPVSVQTALPVPMPSLAPSLADAMKLAADAGTAPPPLQAKSAANRIAFMVADPVAASTLADFGSGCGRWLHLIAAGNPTLEATPLWGSLPRAKQENKLSNLQLNLQQASSFCRSLGANRVALGELNGTPDQCTLKYQIWVMPQKTALGQPFIAQGDEAQIIAQLPALARAMNARLDVAPPSVPKSVGLTPDEMASLGSYENSSHETDAQLSAIVALEPKCPVASMLLLSSRITNDQVQLDQMVQILLQQQPENALAVAQMADYGPSALWPYQKQVDAIIKKYPSNSPLAHAEECVDSLWGTRAGQWQAAQREVADAPNAPAAWEERGDILGNIADDLRNGRYAGEMNSQEWAVLDTDYDQWEGSEYQSVALDPSYGRGWTNLAEAATFNGDHAQAKRAFLKSVQLDPDHSASLGWGLQMFQPKWGGAPGSMHKVVDLAVAANYDNDSQADTIAGELRSMGYPEQAATVLRQVAATDRAEVLQDPGDGSLRWDYAAVLQDLGPGPNLQESNVEYQAALKLLPNAEGLHMAYAMLLDKQGRVQEAIAQCRQAISLNPFDSTTYLNLGADLKQAGQWDQAEAALEHSLRFDPTNGTTYDEIGRDLMAQRKCLQALPFLQESNELYPDNAEVLEDYAMALDGAGKWTLALAVGEQAADQGAQDSGLYDDLADADLNLKRYQESISFSNVALTLNPSDALSHLNLGEAYYKAGQHAEAYRQWQLVVSLRDPQWSPMAQQWLTEHEENQKRV